VDRVARLRTMKFRPRWPAIEFRREIASQRKGVDTVRKTSRQASEWVDTINEMRRHIGRIPRTTKKQFFGALQ
jgi:hypothetical protein